MASQRKVEANRKNANRSTGPRTQRGKENSKHNALKEGVFSRRLNIQEDDRADYEALRSDLFAQLKPFTALQQVIADAIVTAAWRCSQALQREARQLTTQILETATEAAPPTPSAIGYYGTNRNAANRAKDLLAYALEESREEGGLRAETVEQLDRAFGNGFGQKVAQWRSPEHTHLQMLASWQMKAAIFGTAMPEIKGPPIALDPQHHMEMREKLLEMKAEHLDEVSQMLKQAEAGQRTTLQPEPSHRYVGANFRLFMTMVIYYRHLRRAGM